MSECRFRQVFAELVWIWCPDTGEMLWDDDGQLERKFYRSEHWRRYRLRKLEATGYSCESCDSEYQWGYDRPRIHHLSYERLGCERLGDCLALCEECHTAAHSDARRPAAAIHADRECGGHPGVGLLGLTEGHVLCVPEGKVPRFEGGF